MSPETNSAKKQKTAALSEEFCTKLVDVAKASGMSVAEFCDRELLEIVTEKWRAMLEAKLRATASPAIAGA